MSSSTLLTKFLRVEYATSEGRLKVSQADVVFFQTGGIVKELTDIVTRGEPSDLHAICMESRRPIAVIGWTIVLLRRMVPWLCIEGVENTTVAFKAKIPPEKRKAFADLLKPGKLQKQLTNAFANKEKHLEDLLGQHFVCIKSIDLKKLDSVVVVKMEEVSGGGTPKLAGISHSSVSSKTLDVEFKADVIEEGDRVKISWDPIPTLAGYHLSVRRKGAIETAQHHAKRSRLLLNTDEFMRVGCTYELKLIIVEEDEMAESEWTTCVIGDGPKDVTAKPNPTKPHRWVDISFRSPKKSPGLVENYVVSAIPDTGRIRSRDMRHFEKATTFKYLRSSTKYKFEVTAVYQDGDESSRSVSNHVETSTKAGAAPIIDLTNSQAANLSISESVIHLSTINNEQKNEKNAKDFGQVRNSKVTLNDDDSYVISWIPPSFDHDDFRVERYDVEIRTEQGRIAYSESVESTNDQSNHSTNPFKLSSTNHIASITTVYDDIEADKGEIVSTEITLKIPAKQ